MDISTAKWYKSKFSGDTGGHCVEVASNLSGVVAVRDSKRPSATALVTTPAGWSQFLDELKVGRYILTCKLVCRPADRRTREANKHCSAPGLGVRMCR